MKSQAAEDKLKAAMQKRATPKKEDKRIFAMDERKRPYNSMFKVKNPTDKEMEAYYMKKRRQDPMAQFMG
jgi:pre-mRNA-processing factor SLU7